MEIAKELGSVTNDITVPADVKMRRKVNRRKQIGGRVINSLPVTLNDTMTQHNLHSWEWSLAQKLALPNKDMT